MDPRSDQTSASSNGASQNDADDGDLDHRVRERSESGHGSNVIGVDFHVGSREERDKKEAERDGSDRKWESGGVGEVSGERKESGEFVYSVEKSQTLVDGEKCSCSRNDGGEENSTSDDDGGWSSDSSSGRRRRGTSSTELRALS